MTSSVTTKATFRADIQGLRAFAVLVVFAEHLTGRPTGGFVGVDIFFVISGFLITGILAREFRKTGTISFRGFYRRRIKRIIPASVLVLVVTVALVFVLFRRETALSTLWDGVAATFFVANWRLAATGTDYFARGGLPSPLQHFWSLSVEEQFYFVWPWLLLGILLLATTRFRSSARTAVSVAVWVLAALCAASLAWAFIEGGADATVAYFSSLTRVWELGAGAILALTAHRFEKLPAAVRPLLAWVGIGGMVLSVVVIRGSMPFPAPWALLPVLSTVLVLAASIGSPARFNVLLVNPVARFFGDISYSLYLWHFPVIVYLAVVFPDRGIVYFVAVIAAAILLATATYYAFERPLHKSPWLDRRSESSRVSAWSTWWGVQRRPVTVWATIGTAFAVILVAGSAVSVSAASAQQQREVDAAVAAMAETTARLESLPPDLVTPADRIELDLIRALQTQTWPDLSPPLDNVLADGVVRLPGCQPTTPADPSSCTFGDPSMPQIAVLGDSLGLTLLPTVVDAFGAQHHVRGLTRVACPMSPLDVSFPDDASRQRCDAHRTESVEYINATRPQVVLVIQNYEWADRIRPSDTYGEWTRAGEELVASMAPSGASIVFVTPPPRGKTITNCATAISVPADCVSEVHPEWADLAAADSRVKGATTIDTLHWYCTSAGACPPFAGSVLTKRDYVHPTKQYAQNPLLVADLSNMLAELRAP